VPMISPSNLSKVKKLVKRPNKKLPLSEIFGRGSTKLKPPLARIQLNNLLVKRMSSAAWSRRTGALSVSSEIPLFESFQD
jgi:hypothetical protein